MIMILFGALSAGTKIYICIYIHTYIYIYTCKLQPFYVVYNDQGYQQHPINNMIQWNLHLYFYFGFGKFNCTIIDWCLIPLTGNILQTILI